MLIGEGNASKKLKKGELCMSVTGRAAVNAMERESAREEGGGQPRFADKGMIY